LSCRASRQSATGMAAGMMLTSCAQLLRVKESTMGSRLCTSESHVQVYCRPIVARQLWAGFAVAIQQQMILLLTTPLHIPVTCAASLPPLQLQANIISLARLYLSSASGDNRWWQHLICLTCGLSVPFAGRVRRKTLTSCGHMSLRGACASHASETSSLAAAEAAVLEVGTTQQQAGVQQ
jgi:hypothetical protein